LVDSDDLKNCVKVIGIILQEIANTPALKKWRLSEEEINNRLNKSGLDELLQLRNMQI